MCALLVPCIVACRDRLKFKSLVSSRVFAGVAKTVTLEAKRPLWAALELASA